MSSHTFIGVIEMSDTASREHASAETDEIVDELARVLSDADVARRQEPTEPSETAVFVVHGMGCSVYEPYDLWQLTRERFKAVIGASVLPQCDLNMGRTLRAVAGQCSRMHRTRAANEFVLDVAQSVQYYLEDGSDVIVVGHSYGGMVASLVVRVLLRAGVDLSRLRVQTYGSLYIPAEHKVEGAHITHVVAAGDVVCLCNGTHQISKVLERHTPLLLEYAGRAPFVAKELAEQVRAEVPDRDLRLLERADMRHGYLWWALPGVGSDAKSAWKRGWEIHRDAYHEMASSFVIGSMGTVALRGSNYPNSAWARFLSELSLGIGRHGEERSADVKDTQRQLASALKTSFAHNADALAPVLRSHGEEQGAATNVHAGDEVGIGQDGGRSPDRSTPFTCMLLCLSTSLALTASYAA